MIDPEIMHGIKRSEINPLRDSLPGFDFQWRLRVAGAGWRNRLTFASSYLEPKP